MDETIGSFLDQVKEHLEDTKKEREQSLTRDEAVASFLPKVSMTAIHLRRAGRRSAHPVTGSDTDSASMRPLRLRSVSALNTADEPEATRIERHASWAELFFDLVAVAGVAALAHVLGSELDAAALGLYALLFLAFWLSWTTFMLYSNVAAGQTRVVRLLIGMFGLGVMAASVPGVAHSVLGDGDSVRPLTSLRSRTSPRASTGLTRGAGAKYCWTSRWRSTR
ncbi:MAG TPA: low temperature requirement protein A [Streptosporangiaceae bacterium]